MTLPATTDAVRDAAMRLLKLSPSDADADRIADLAGKVLELVRIELDRPVPYTDADIPGPVVEAAAQATAEAYRRKDTPFGIAGAWSEGGEAFRVSRDLLGGVEPTLAPYKAGWGIA